MIIKINSNDITSAVILDSFRIEQVISKEADNLKMTLIDPANAPEILQEVEVKDDDDDIIFGGVVASIYTKNVSQKITYDLVCKDYTELMDGKYVVESYEDKTANEIIADIQSKYLPAGITITNVDCDTELAYVAFNYEKPSKCLERLAELCLADWYIDYNKDIHFFLRADNPAPFGLTDDNNNYESSSLVTKEDASQIKNTIYVRGGEYKGASYTEKQLADGDQTTFNLAYRYSGLTVTVDSVAQDVGIDFLDDEADHDCLYNFEMKTLRFRSDNKPTAGQLVEITGLPYIPVYIKSEESASVTKYGVKEFKIVENKIKSKGGAIDRAQAELETYRESLNDGSFYTLKKGLRAGQKINIQSTKRGLNKDFYISRLSITAPTKSQLKYSANLISAPTYDIVGLLQQLLDRTEVNESREGEILEKIYNLYEDLTIDEAIAISEPMEVAESISISENVRKDPWTLECVLAPYQVTGDSDNKREFLLDHGILN